LPATVVVLRVSGPPEDDDDDEEDDDDDGAAAAGVLEVLLPLLPPQPARARVEAAERAAKRSAARLFMMSPSLRDGGRPPLTMETTPNPNWFMPRQNCCE
jgi:hypothetical protein